MNSLVKFMLPAYFINDRVVLSPLELRYGWENQWLSDGDAVKVALYGLMHRPTVPAVYEEIALLLSDDLDRIAQLMSELESMGTESADPGAVWLYLSLGWLYEHRDRFDDPLQVVEMIYADFEYPPEIADFVRFLPPPTDAAVGVDALYDRWRDYLDRKAAVYGIS